MRKCRFIYIFSAFLILLSIGISPISAFALTPQDYQTYKLQQIGLLDTSNGGCGSDSSGGGALNGPAPTSLTGSTNQQKVWNYFIQRGLTPVAAAGAMGNIEQEDGSFQATTLENDGTGDGGFGLIQWTGSRATNLRKAATAVGVTISNDDASLLFELNWLWSGEYNAMTWEKQVNAETTVEGNTAIASYNPAYTSQLASSQTGNGSTMVFHALVERSGDTPTQLETRIKNAEGFLTQFSGGASGGNCSSIGAGGLTFDQAVTLAKKVLDNWTGIYCGSGAITTGGNPGGYCDWTTGYCTAGSALIAAITAPDPSKVPGIPNGGAVADRLISADSSVYTGVTPTGSNLQPFSIWSLGDGGDGHTGTIVGVGQDGSIITFETNWLGNLPAASQHFSYSAGGHVDAVFEYPSFNAFKSSHPGYTFVNAATPLNGTIESQMAAKMQKFLGS